MNGKFMNIGLSTGQIVKVVGYSGIWRIRFIETWGHGVAFLNKFESKCGKLAFNVGPEISAPLSHCFPMLKHEIHDEIRLIESELVDLRNKEQNLEDSKSVLEKCADFLEK